MKRVILFLFVIFFFACSNEKMTLSKLNEIEQKELASGVKNDSIFIGFKFGMSQTEVSKKADELVKSGVLSLVDNKYVYKFTFDYPKEAVAKFQTNYFEDKLYEFSLKYDANTQTEAVIIQLKMVGLFMKKYGRFIEIPNILVETENDYVFIKGNKKIEINYPAYSTSVFVTYIDLGLKEEMDNAEKIKQINAEKKSISDI